MPMCAACALLERAGLPVRRRRSARRALDGMRIDKKVKAGRMRLVLLQRLGAAVSPRIIRTTLQTLEHAFRARRGDAEPLAPTAARRSVARPAPPEPRRPSTAANSSAIATASCTPMRSVAWSTRPRCS
jgi:hypothetical protein